MRAAPVDVDTRRKVGPLELTHTTSWRHGRALKTWTVAVHLLGRYYMVSFTRTAPLPIRIIPK